jgi:NAD(P) transhydrogenase subunit alpha
MAMRIGVPAESMPGERRVAATPRTVESWRRSEFDVVVESGAGSGADIPDDAYREAGAQILESADAVLGDADIVVKVRPPRRLDDGRHEVELMAEGAVLISLIDPARHEDLVDRLSQRGATVLALDQVPRITRAQSVDVLSSMASIAGYRAVIEAASHYGRFFGARSTAAGSSPPAEVMVIGAGVAGLAAIATARELGANVKAFDVRPTVETEVESLGARFLELDIPREGAEGEGGYAAEMDEAFIEKEMELFRREVPETDIVITTAAIPGKPAPTLVTREMVASMQPGSVIVDLAAETGGNCEVTETGNAIEHDGVEVLGYTDLTSRLPTQASDYFGRNVSNLFRFLGDADAFQVDPDDDVIRGMLVLEEGEERWPPPEPEEPSPSADEPETQPAEEKGASSSSEETTEPLGGLAVPAAATAAVGLLILIGLYAPASFVQHLTVFVLACFVGWRVIWDVTSSLHTPLMSVTNAISGIIIVGGIIQVTQGASWPTLLLGAAAVLVASINIFGGFWVTQRMLGMFRADDAPSGGRE